MVTKITNYFIVFSSLFDITNDTNVFSVLMVASTSSLKKMPYILTILSNFKNNSKGKVSLIYCPLSNMPFLFILLHESLGV